MPNEGLSAYFASLHMCLSSVISLLSLSFTITLYLAYRGKGTDLTCRSPKLQVAVYFYVK
jgi:hypothetical protein